MSTDSQGTKWRRNIAENFNGLSRVHERYRQTTDGRATFANYVPYRLSFCGVSVIPSLSVLVELTCEMDRLTDRHSATMLTYRKDGQCFKPGIE